MTKYPRYPVDYVGITQYYSQRHRALDLGWHTPEPPVMSVADGTVISAGTESATRGIYAVVRHEGLIEGKLVYTLYWHLKSLAVARGQVIKQGERIGIMGSTGLATGVHLHFGFWICPESYRVWNLADQAIYAVDPLTQVYLYPDQQQAASNRGVRTLPAAPAPEAPAPEIPAPAAVKAGQTVRLSRAPLYASAAAARPAGWASGTYYAWDAQIISGRRRITNLPARVGVRGQVTGWVDAALFGGAAARSHTVSRGETLSGIAARYGTTLAVLAKLNPQITNLNLIYPGQIISLPQ